MSISYTSNEERCALSWFGLAGFKILLYNFFFFFVNCMSFPLSFPDCQAAQCQSFTSKLGTLQEAGAEIAFWWARFHAEQEAAAQRWIGRPRLSANEMWWTSEFYWHAAAELAKAAGAVFLIPCSWGWEFDPILSVRNDTYLLDYAAWKREKTVPSVRHYRNQTFLLLK